jgi:hypothetical protein
VLGGEVGGGYGFFGTAHGFEKDFLGEAAGRVEVGCFEFGQAVRAIWGGVGSVLFVLPLDNPQLYLWRLEERFVDVQGNGLFW